MTGTILRLAARRDIESAARWYVQEAGYNVALRFTAAAEDAVTHLLDHPEAGAPSWQYRLQRDGLRAWPLKGFPYLVFYRVKGGRPDILRVLHAARDIPARFRD